MGYGIHIERESPFTLVEWKSAVEETDGVRIDASGASAINPETQELISVGGTVGDAKVLIGGKWLPCFSWQESGSVVFRAPDDFDNPKSTIRKVARRLAAILGAHLVGDEGEEYD